MRVQPKRMVQAIEDLASKATDPYHREILDNFKRHYMAEVSCDLEATLATMVENPVYHEYGNARTDFPHPGRVAVQSKEENRAYYQFGFDNGMSVFEIEHDRLMVSDQGVAGDGVMHIILPTHLVKMFAPYYEGPLEDSAHYLVSIRIGYFFPYENGLCAGEDTYQDPTTAVVTRLDPADVVTAEAAFA